MTHRRRHRSWPASCAASSRRCRRSVRTSRSSRAPTTSPIRSPNYRVTRASQRRDRHPGRLLALGRQLLQRLLPRVLPRRDRGGRQSRSGRHAAEADGRLSGGGAVVEKVAAMAKWGEALPAGKAKGFAFTLSFGSWVGEIVQVADTPAGIRIEKVWIAADLGTALDPGIIEAQLISGAIYGLSAAMGQEITFADGMVEQSNFHDFDAMRIYQCPDFEVAILENYHKMGGAGEVGTPPAAPALANAVLALTGKRIRSLPIVEAGGVRMRLIRIILTSAAMLRRWLARLAAGRCRADRRPTACGVVEQDLCGLFASALRQLPCRGRPSALVRRALRRHPRAWLQCPARRRRQRLRQSGPALHDAVISPAIPACCMARREPRTGIWRRPKWSGGKSRRPKSAPRSRIPSAMAAARSRQVAIACARRSSWSAGGGIPAPAASRRPARPRRPIAPSRTGLRPARLARPIDAAMNFCDYFAALLLL